MEQKNNSINITPYPVCGGRPQVSHIADPWDDWLVNCPNCGFSYSENGSFGDTKEEAIQIWNSEVQLCGLDEVSISTAHNKEHSKYWKEKREWYLQQNKKKD